MIQITWTAVPEMDQNGIITRYDVFYTSTFDFVDDSVVINNGATFSINITGLEEFVVYNVSVRAYTSVGSGPFSDDVREQTGGAGECEIHT